MLNAPFECCVTIKSGNDDVYLNEIPGGQYTNLQFQTYSLGLGNQFEAASMGLLVLDVLKSDLIEVKPTTIRYFHAIYELIDELICNFFNFLSALVIDFEHATFEKQSNGVLHPGNMVGSCSTASTIIYIVIPAFRLPNLLSITFYGSGIYGLAIRKGSHILPPPMNAVIILLNHLL